MAVFLGLVHSGSWADEAKKEGPVIGGGDIGLGLELGGPSAWGVSGKLWVDRNSAFQPAIKLGESTSILQLDYLIHNYTIAHPKSGLMPFYLGFGGNLILQNNVYIGARGVGGLSYIFDKVDVPVDIFIQLAPTLWFYTSGSHFDLYGEVGAHYYF
jgi:hypothetical protein